MKLSEIFYLLSSGEMSQLYTGLHVDSGIDEPHQKAVIGSVQLALTALYTRFMLKQGQLELRLVEGKTDYKLHSKYADFGKATNEPVRWIADSISVPFKDDILKIERIITPIGLDMSVNNANDPYTVFTPTMDSLRVPNGMVNDVEGTPDWLEVESLQVLYKANHPKISLGFGCFNSTTTEIELPNSHVQALLYFVASRASNPVGMGQEFNSGNQWYSKYEMECQRLEHSGQSIDTLSQPNRFNQKGFV